jgi:hypothetical protein
MTKDIKVGDFGLFRFYVGKDGQAVPFTIHATVKDIDRGRVYLMDNHGFAYIPKKSNIREFKKMELNKTLCK